MADSSLTTELGKVIERLQKERQEHTDRIAQIDGVFEQYGIQAAGGATGGKRRGRRPGRPKGSKNSTTAAPKAKRGRRKRGKFAVTGEQMIVDFVKANSKPTTAEINAEWKRQGRGGSADNTLTRLVGNEQLKRMKLKNERGSRYSAA